MRYGSTSAFVGEERSRSTRSKKCPWEKSQRSIASPARDDRRTLVVVTPFDAPNLTLKLNRAIELGTYFGLRREGTEVQLFVDDPHALRDEITAAAPT